MLRLVPLPDEPPRESRRELRANEGRLWFWIALQAGYDGLTG